MPQGKIRVCILQRAAEEDWRGYVRLHPHATLFHELGWKRAVERAFGHRAHYLIAYRGDRVIGVLPLFEVRSVLAGRILVSVPYAIYGGILAENAEACEAILRRAESLGQTIGARSIELRSMTAASSRLIIRRTHATFRRPMPCISTSPRASSSDAEQAVLAFLPRKARAAARRAVQRYALTVDFGDQNLPDIWQLYVRSMRRLGSPNYPFQFFDELVRAMPDKHVVQVVFHEGHPVAGLLTFLHRDDVMPYFMGLDERANLYGLSHYLYLQSMRWGVERGYRLYDFGRTRVDNTGSFNFKRFCGFEPKILEYQVREMPGRVAPNLSPSSPRWRAARRVWKTLPLTVTRPLGSWLAKSIPG